MAILQISQITQRKGLQIDLPQLAGAEFGWSIDERRLWIGNGTLAEGAPVIGNTEILTEYSNITAILNYTYSGAPSAVPISYQTRLDQYVNVADFGVLPDTGIDVSSTINTVLLEMYSPTAIAPPRALFFPAGTYTFNSPLLIPANATIYGDGADNTIIQYTGASGTFAAQTVDSTGGTTATSYITVSNMGFNCSGGAGAVLIQNASNTTFSNVSFTGNSNLTSDSLIGFGVTVANSVKQVIFDNCDFTNASSAVSTIAAVTGIEFTNSYFSNLNQGILLGTTAASTGPVGVRITNNLFDGIFNESIIVGNPLAIDAGYTQNITTGHNVFLNTVTPTVTIITFNDKNCLSVGDMFDSSTTSPFVLISSTDVIATQNGASLSLGQYTRNSSKVATLFNATTATLFTQNVTNINALSFDYTLIRTVGGVPVVRTGEFEISSTILGTVSSTDEYTETAVSGVTFTVSRVANTVTVTYTTDGTGNNALMQYSINYFN